MNVKLDEIPTIDDISCIPHLRNSVHSQPDGANTRIELVGALLTASFFFELNALPEQRDGFFRCHGRVCLRNHSYGVVQALAKAVPGKLAFMNDDGFLTAFDGVQDICLQCYRYRRPVTFHVRDLSSMVTIYLHGKSMPKRRISGFPQTLQWFVNQQKLNAVFGIPDQLSRAQCEACDGNTPKRKALMSVTGGSWQKRRRWREDSIDDVQPSETIDPSFI